ncbi:MAG: endo,4-beta-xylanase precursor [Flavipsychrobacter sp.]|nr:endo,4-beta-xylanase precursor [Flavipsychrobacter sp.]
MKNLLFIVVLLFSFAPKGYSLGPIYSDTLICTGSVYPFTIATPGGTWESSDTAIGKIDTTTGQLTAVSVGALTITYHMGSVYVIRKVTVRKGVTPIIGNTEVCVGDTIALTDTTTGGTWSSSEPYYASVDTEGRVAGVTATAYHYPQVTITYMLPGGCFAGIHVDVYAPGGTMYHSYGLCVQGAAKYTNTDTGGRWSMYDTTFAVIDSVSGWAHGKAIGPDTVFYTVTNVCGLATSSYPIHIYEENSSACWINVPVENRQTDDISIFPNPVQNVLTVTTDALYPINSVSVMNVSGRSVLSRSCSASDAQIDVSALSPGIYFIKVNGREAKRIIKN